MTKKNIKVLVVDDSPSITEVLDLILRDNGYEVCLASDGKEGLKIFETAHPDLVITDIVMPDMEGIMIIML